MAAAEALNLAAHSGLDSGTTFDMLLAGAGTSSRMVEVRGPSMLAGPLPGDSTTVRVLDKSVSRDFAENAGVPVPLLSVVCSSLTPPAARTSPDADSAVRSTALHSLVVAAPAA